MADAIVSAVAEQLVSIFTAQIQNEIHLVRGVDKELLDLSHKLKNIRNVLDDADRKQFKDKTVKDRLWRLEQTSYEMEDVLDEWNYAILQHKIQSQSESVASSNRKFQRHTNAGKSSKQENDVRGRLSERGQFISMVCLLHKTLPHRATSLTSNGSLTVFRAKDYNATIEFYWAPLLLESNCDNAVAHKEIRDRIVRSGSINKHGEHWKGADILAFNSYAWWVNGLKFKILK